MVDELVTGLVPDSDLRVVAALVTQTARHARQIHSLHPASAALLAQGLCAGALLSALQKESARINLQLSCDGPLGGLFVDADSGGALRGYVKNGLVDFLGPEGEFRYRPALGNSGFLSVLRERGQGEFYRSSVELRHFDLARDLQEFFTLSEQLPAAIALSVVSEGPEELGQVAGLLLQPLPGGDRQAFEAMGERLAGPQGLAAALRAKPGAEISTLAKAALGREDLDVLFRTELNYRCNCSKERMITALASLGAKELEDLIATQGHAEVICQFCGKHHLASKEELSALLA